VEFGRIFFLYGVIAVFLIGFVLSLLFTILRNKEHKRGSKTWLLLVTLIFIGYAIYLKKNPEEAFHFVQYGFLSILIFRALSNQIQDWTLYFTAAIIGGLIGIIDESIQWLTPGRFWGLRDIWINFFAAALIQVGIAKGFCPHFISNKANFRSLVILCRVVIVGLIFLQLSFLNTPDRILWYADKIPSLSFLKENESTMLEYGYLHKDPEIGMFRSRFTLEQLRRIDSLRALEAAKIIDQFQNRDSYRKFLEKYTPISDPFLHEMRVHLFSRNINLQISRESGNDKKKYTKYITRAYRENQILEKYFSKTLKHSSFFWNDTLTSKIKKDISSQNVYESATAEDLITRINEAQLNGLLLTVIFILMILQVHYTRKSMRDG